MRNDLSSMFSPRDRRSYKKDYSRKLGWKGKLLMAGLILCAFAWAYQALALTPENLGAERVHAEERIKGNKDYCQEWKRGVWNVVGATQDQMTKLCAKYE